MRRHLAKIGLTSSLESMSYCRAELLEAVGNEFDRMEAASMKEKANAKKGGNRGR